VRDIEMAPEDFLLLAADQADEVIVLDRPAHRHGGVRFNRSWLGLLPTEDVKRVADRLDQVADQHVDSVPGDVGGDDLRRERHDPPRLLLLRASACSATGPPPPDHVRAG
jgi:hypothetical protein